MLVGHAGVGKTALVGDVLAGLPEDYVVSRVPFNYHTTSAALQSKCPPACVPGARGRRRSGRDTQPREVTTFSGLQAFSQASDELVLVTIPGKYTWFIYCDFGFSYHSWIYLDYCSSEEPEFTSVVFVALPLNPWGSFSQFHGS